MNKDLFFNGEKFISAKRAAEETGYASDHIASLARGRKVLGKRIGRTWYVSERSLSAYKAGAPLPVPKHIRITLTPDEQAVTDSTDLFFKGERFITSLEAAKLVGYAPDHVAALARKGYVRGRMMGRTWYVSRASILAHKKGPKMARAVAKPRVRPAKSLAASAHAEHMPVVQPTASSQVLAERIAYQSGGAAELVHIAKPVERARSTMFLNSRLEKAVVAATALAIIGASGSYLLNAVSPAASSALAGRLARVQPASALMSFFSPLRTPRQELALAAEPSAASRANETTLSEILSGAPAPVIGKLRDDLRKDLLAYAKSEIAREVGTIRSKAPAAPLVINTYTTYNEVVQAANQHTSAQSESDMRVVSQGLSSLQVNGTITNPAISGGTIKRASITDSSFSGGTITLGQNDTATLPNLAFGIATGTSATTTNLFSTNGVFGTLTAGTLSVDQNTFSVNSGLTLVQKTNGATQVSARRATDTLPSGDFISYTNAAGDTPLFRVDNSGNIFAGGITNSGAFTVTSLSEPQLRVQHDAGNEITVDVDANGVATYGAIGSTPRILWRPSVNRTDTFQFQDKDGNAVLSLDTANRLATLANLLVSGSSTLQNFTFTNATGTSATTTNLYSAALTAGNATTTNLFSSTASSTNLFSTNATLGTLTAGPITSGLVNGQTISSAANFTGSLTATGGLTTLSNLLLTGSTTLQNFTFTSATGTSATTTNLYTSGQTTLAGAGGNVGIGVTDPTEKLDVSGNIAIRSSNPILKFLASDKSLRGKLDYTLATGGANGRLDFYVDNASAVATNIMSITGGGNVGIGTTTPSGLLQVATNGSSAFAAFGVPGQKDAYIRLYGSAGIAHEANIYNDATYGLHIDTNSNSRKVAIDGSSLIINAAGTANYNVGIGITNPSQALTVQTSASGDIAQFITSAASGQGLKLGIDTTNHYMYLKSNTSNYAYSFQDGAGTPDLTILTSNGNVGIGTTTPQAKLSVIGAVRSGAIAGTSYTELQNDGVYTTGTDLFLLAPASRDVHIYAGNTEKLTVLNGGNVGIGTTNPGTKLTVDGSGNGGALIKVVNSTAGTGNYAGYQLTSDSATGGFLYLTTSTYNTSRSSTASPVNVANSLQLLHDTKIALASPNGEIDLYAGGNTTPTLQQAITSTGVGIGTTTPQDKLEVAGGSLRVGTAGHDFQIGNAGRGFAFNRNTDNGAIFNPTGYAYQLNHTGISTTNTSDYLAWQVYDQNGSTVTQNALVLNGQGSVGIGVTNPSSALHVRKDIGASIGFGDQVRVDSGVSGHVAGLHLTDGITSDAFVTFVPSATAGSRYISVSASNALSDLVVNGLGNVGIGTTGPGALLDIGGTNNKNFLVNSGATTGYAYMTVSNTGGNLLTGVSGSTGAFWGDGAMGAYSSTIGTSVATNLVFATNNAQRLTILSGGNVGIGITNPTAKLEITNPDTASDLMGLRINQNDPGNWGAQFAGAYGVTIDSTTQTALRTTGTGNIQFMSGNVGIGITNPSYPLDVVGNIHSSSGVVADGTLWTGDSIRKLSPSQVLTFRNSGGTGEMVIDGSGNVGIGTTNPGATLQVAGKVITAGPSGDGDGNNGITIDYGNASGIVRGFLALRANGTTNASLGLNMIDSSNADLLFYTRGSNATGERMRITKDGNVGIGTTNPSSLFTVRTAGSAAVGTPGTYGIQLKDSSDLSQFSIGQDSTYVYLQSWNSKPIQINNQGNNVILNGGGSGAVGIGTTNPSTDGAKLEVSGRIYASDRIYGNRLSSVSGVIDFDEASGSNFYSWSSPNLDLYLGGSFIQRVTSSGRVGIGTTNPAAAKFVVSSDLNALTGIEIDDTTSTLNGAFIAFKNSAGAVTGTITQTGTTATTYNTTSDKRLKNDLGVASTTDVLKDIVIHNFSWKTDGSLDEGVFAQDAYLVKPSAVHVGGDAVNENGVLTNPWGVDYSKFVPDLIVGWQVHEGRLVALEATASTTASTTSALVSALGLNLADATAGLDIDREVILRKGLKVDQIGAIGDVLALASDTEFIGRPYFNSDMGGLAEVEAGQRKVDVAFDKPYIDAPVVNATITFDASSTDADANGVFDNSISYVVTSRSQTGFSILLSKPAPQKITFSWTALAIQHMRISNSGIASPVINVAVPTTSSTASPADTSTATSTTPASDASVSTSTASSTTAAPSGTTTATTTDTAAITGTSTAPDTTTPSAPADTSTSTPTT